MAPLFSEFNRTQNLLTLYDIAIRMAREKRLATHFCAKWSGHADSIRAHESVRKGHVVVSQVDRWLLLCYRDVATSYAYQDMAQEHSRMSLHNVFCEKILQYHLLCRVDAPPAPIPGATWALYEATFSQPRSTDGRCISYGAQWWLWDMWLWMCFFWLTNFTQSW